MQSDAPPSEEYVVYRAANYETPLRSEGSRNNGRFNRVDTDEPTQYLCLHPLGPLAEYVRHNGPIDDYALRPVRTRTWVLRLRTPPLTRIGFANATSFGIDAADLVADDKTKCQDLADRMRAGGIPGIVVPSAALPGTENVVLFGPRVAIAYDQAPVSAIDVPCGITSDNGQPPTDLLSVVRQHGEPHAGLNAWLQGATYDFIEPRWRVRGSFGGDST